MSLIGEYSKKSTILLELLTKDEKNTMILADKLPEFTIEFYDGNGLIQVYHDTLEEIDAGRYFMALSIPETWNDGDYLVTYHATLDGLDYTAKERFSVKDSLDMILQEIGSPSSDNTSIYDQLKSISHATLVHITDYTLLTDSNEYTTVIINDTPIANAVVNVWSYNNSDELIAKTATDIGGHWAVDVYPGSYTFEFIHPNGMILRRIDKVVS